MKTGQTNLGNGDEEAPDHVAAETRFLLARMASEKVADVGKSKVIDLTVDSVLEIMALGTESDPSFPRTLTFEGSGWQLEVAVIRQGGRRNLKGSLREGTAGQELRIRQARATTRVVLDEQNSFEVQGLMPGPVSLIWLSSDQSPVETSWVSI